ncbi:cytochrome [Burkholderia ubonensis]|uniref:cytochrome P450 n=1 Tax=Burkholderia ubonensis TaxID=101571 RepID=UPI00075A8B96|nr:cytochrome P450 [Burkholderia ubonensis]KVX92484.1 cytochrome [Burkholderia ubonensis]KWA68095.1 cytochrome [Burkholderia ubonensis]
MSTDTSTITTCPVRKRLALRRKYWKLPDAGVNHWLDIQRDPLKWLADMHRTSPDLASLRMGVKQLWCLFHPDAIRELMVSHRADLRRWEPSLCIMRQWNGASFMMKEGEAARRQRQTVRPHIQSPAVPEIQRIARHWSARIVPGQVVDLDLEMAAYSVTLAGHALFDIDLGPNAVTIAKAVRILSRVALLESSTGLPLGHWFPSKMCPRKRWALRVMRAQIEQVAKESQRPLAMHRDDLATLLMASHQATGATLAWAQLLLARHPEVLAALRTELAAIDWSGVNQLQDLHRAPLLRAVIQETLRLYPPAYALVPRQLSRAMTVSGTPLRRGDIVMISSWITHRDARWFPEPEAFRPERFLEAPTWPQGAYFPFGVGDRACPGTGMAMMDLAVSLAYWIEHWDMTIVGPVTPQGWFSLRPKNARVRLEPRMRADREPNETPCR